MTHSLTTYTDETAGYSISYPNGWRVTADPDGGATFEPAGPAEVGAVVFVDRELAVRGTDPTLAEYVAAFLDDLAADAHVHSLDVRARRDVTLTAGRSGQVVECTYVGDRPGERWRLLYLFVVDDDTGYTVGVDWNEVLALDELAADVVGSFAFVDRPST